MVFTIELQAKMRNNPAVFKVPRELLDDMDGTNKLKQLVGSLLTKNRGTMKQKVRWYDYY